jgi:hypothetical protein
VSTNINTIPDSFVIKYDGYNTTYVKQPAPLGNTSTTVYTKISGRTDGSDSMGSPVGITAKEFEDAYKEFKKTTFLLDNSIKDPTKAVVGRTMTEDGVKKFICAQEYARLAKPDVIKPPEYWTKHREDWMKINCK